jgi:hypothetical protein
MSVAAQERRDVMAIYSDVCRHADSGDLLGDRIFLFKSQDRLYVMLQAAEGVFTQPNLGGGDHRRRPDQIRASPSIRTVHHLPVEHHAGRDHW